MKKKLLTTGILLCSLFIGCNSDDDQNMTNENIETNDLVGSWQITSASESGFEEISNDCDRMGILTINSDGTGNQTSFTEIENSENCIEDDPLSFTYITNNNLINLTFGDDEDDTETGDFDIENNILTLRYFGDSGNFVQIFNRVSN